MGLELLMIVCGAGQTVARVGDKAFALAFSESEGYTPRPLRGVPAALPPELLRNPDAAIERIEQVLSDWDGWARARFTLKPRFGSSGRRGRSPGRGSSPGP